MCVHREKAVSTTAREWPSARKEEALGGMKPADT